MRLVCLLFLFKGADRRSQQQFRGQPGKAFQGEARPEPAQGLLVIAHLSSIILGNPHEIIVSQESHPVGAGGGDALGKEVGRLVQPVRGCG